MAAGSMSGFFFFNSDLKKLICLLFSVQNAAFKDYLERSFLPFKLCIHTSVLPVNEISNTGIAGTASHVSCVMPSAIQKPEIRL